jgi:putative transposase
VARSSFYIWKKKVLSPRQRGKMKVCASIKKSFKESKGTYGSPRIFKELKSKGLPSSVNTVAKYMKETGLDARLRKKYKVQTTDSNHTYPIAPRLFRVEDKNPLPAAPGKLLAGDITYLRIDKKFIYLAVVLDLFNREVIGWSMSENLKTPLVLNALDMAMKNVGPDAEIIFHSDRGSQYASEAYRNFLKSRNIMPSMSRRGNCYDNSYVESWFASFKKEWIYRHQYSTERQLRGLVFEYIESWYNRRRKHSALDYKSPEEYRINYQIA